MPKPKPSIFISHSSVDADIVDHLRRDLSRLHLTIWDDKELKPGENLNEQLEQALQQSAIYLLFVDPESLKSNWSNFEIGVAAARASRSEDVELIPILRRGAKWDDLPAPLRQRGGINANRMSADELSRTLQTKLQKFSEQK